MSIVRSVRKYQKASKRLKWFIIIYTCLWWFTKRLKTLDNYFVYFKTQNNSITNFMVKTQNSNL